MVGAAVVVVVGAAVVGGAVVGGAVVGGAVVGGGGGAVVGGGGAVVDGGGAGKATLPARDVDVDGAAGSGAADSVVEVVSGAAYVSETVV